MATKTIICDTDFIKYYINYYYYLRWRCYVNVYVFYVCIFSVHFLVSCNNTAVFPNYSSSLTPM